MKFDDNFLEKERIILQSQDRMAKSLLNEENTNNCSEKSEVEKFYTSKYFLLFSEYTTIH
ncbi:MAG: hypothetical protein Q8S21_01570 [Candidatus Paracaedibacteraceae bacterium]|nr:hypothetical protein [Candidatus Paracaedibacteraceae bacterium]